MHDNNLLQLITDDVAPAQQLLDLLGQESLALHGRDMQLLEHILASKQGLIILLEQHGRRRSEILASLGLPTDRSGLEQLAAHSSIGEQLLSCPRAMSSINCSAIAGTPMSAMAARSRSNRRAPPTNCASSMAANPRPCTTLAAQPPRS